MYVYSIAKAIIWVLPVVIALILFYIESKYE